LICSGGFQFEVVSCSPKSTGKIVSADQEAETNTMATLSVVVTSPPRKSTSTNLILLPSPRYPKPPGGEKDEGGSESRKVTFSVGGMVCAACSSSVEKAVKRLSGVLDASVALLQNKAQVVYNVDIIAVYQSPSIISPKACFSGLSYKRKH
jgi:copper chaperone CopZ